MDRGRRAKFYRRARCFLIHRWWIPTYSTPLVTLVGGFPFIEDANRYRCSRCGEEWSRP